MSDANNILKISNLHIGYQQDGALISLLKNVELHVEKGRTIGVFGINGVGKTTFLKSISGIIKPLEGEVKFNHNSNISKVLSFVSTEKIVSGFIKVFDLVSIGRYPYTGWFGKLSDNDILLVEQALKHVNAYQFKDRYLNELSDGERQRVMIARAIAQETDVIILDEPTSYLDIPNTSDVMMLLKKISGQKGKTIILSSHNLDVLLNITDKLWILDNENILECEVSTIESNIAFKKYLQKIGISLMQTDGYFTTKYKLT